MLCERSHLLPGGLGADPRRARRGKAVAGEAVGTSSPSSRELASVAFLLLGSCDKC